MPDERRQHILEHPDRDGQVLATALARRFGISEDAARRDLRQLTTVGPCRRVHGGAPPLSVAGRPITEREREQPVGKAAPGRAGVVLVAQAMRWHEMPFLDAGSITLSVTLSTAQALPPGPGITGATDAPGVAAVLVGPGIELVVPGGRIDPRTGAARGLVAMRIGPALLGACAVDAEAGLGAFALEDATFKCQAAQATATVAVVATSSKLAAAAPFAAMQADRPAHLVVKAGFPSARPDRFAALGIGIAVHHASAP